MRCRCLPTICLVAMLLGALVEATPEARGADVEGSLALPRPAYPVNEPVYVGLELLNGGGAPVTVPGDCLRPSSLRLRRHGLTTDARARKNSREKEVLLAPGESLKREFDLARHFKEVAEAGRYDLSWRCGDWSSRSYEVFLVEPYDPEKDRIAVVETTLGTLELVLMPEQAPRHVEIFVQLARQGYYDGTLFNRLVPGLQIEGGLRPGEGGGGWAYQLQAEIDQSIIPGKGLVGAARRETSLTSATQFFILLNSVVQYRGFHTFFAYVRQGQEVLDAMSQVEILGDSGGAAYRPAQPIEIRRIEIRPE